MRVFLRVVAGLLVVALVGVVALYLYARPLIRTGTGYAAHNSCGVVLLAGRDDPEADLPPNPLVPYLTGYESRTGRNSTAAMLWLLSKRTAHYTAGYGCTVSDGRPTLTPERATRVSADPNPISAAPSPEPSPELRQVVGRAFGDDLSPAEQRRLGTRAVVVLRDGQLVAERYADGFDARTPQLGWSMSKSVANLLVGRYALERDIDVTTEKDLRPEWRDARRDITVDQLMRMTSGLTWDETYDLGTPITEMLYTERDMAGYAAAQPLAHPPGRYQQYSSGSTNILCDWLTELADVRDTDFPRTALFAPLGLSSAVWEPDASGTPVCSSYLWATPRDWATVGQFALQDGVWGGQRLVPEGWMAASTTATRVDRGEERGYAAGWWVNTQADGGLADRGLPADAYWMSGHDGQRVYVVPSARLVVVRLGFSPEVADEALRTDRLVADLVTLGAPAP
ncbi:MAG: serine hydrolase domain-containing protein [Phycicoccus sp.]